MKQHWIQPVVISLSAVILILTAVSSRADVKKIYGRAVNSEGELVFFEEHFARYENDRIAALKTNYYDADYLKIGEQVSDFSHGPQFGSYDFRDERLQYQDGAKVMANQILIYRKETPKAGTKEKYLKRESDQIVGQGFYAFILENFDALVHGDVVSAKLVLPAQMDQFDICIRKSKIKDGRLYIRIELDNWFLRLFAPNAEAKYDLATRRLLSYRGISMVADESGKNVPVTVSYDYSQQPSLLSSRFTSGPAGFHQN